MLDQFLLILTEVTLLIIVGLATLLAHNLPKKYGRTVIFNKVFHFLSLGPCLHDTINVVIRISALCVFDLSEFCLPRYKCL